MTSHKPNTFKKQERLNSKRLIEKLFKEGNAFLVYPFRVVYMINNDENFDHIKAPVQVLVSVSKKKFKSAVKRNRIKRLMRESYRINKHDLTEYLAKSKIKLLLGLVFIGDTMPEYSLTGKKIITILKRLKEELSQT
jgi:ribonuclease P protein component